MPIKEWPPPAQRLNLMELSDPTPYLTEIYRDRSKIKGIVGKVAANICGPVLKNQCRYKLQNLLFKQSSRTNSDFEGTGRTFIPIRPQRQSSSHLHRQQSDLSLPDKQFYTQPLNCRNTKEGSTTHDAELVNLLRMGEGICWNRGKWGGTQNSQRKRRERRWTKYSMQ